MEKEKSVFVQMSGDMLHAGHINILRNAAKYGVVTVGLMSDRAMLTYKRLPFLSYEQRKEVLISIKYVSKVFKQDSLDLVESLMHFKPDYLVNGDDWKTGVQQKTRAIAIETLKLWGGKLIEIPYTKGISSSAINKAAKQGGVDPSIRQDRFLRLIENKTTLQMIGVHSFLSALAIQNCNAKNEFGVDLEFDGLYLDTEIDFVNRGKSKCEEVFLASRIESLKEILKTTADPVIFSLKGIEGKQVFYTIKTLDELGVSSVILDEKNLNKEFFLKINEIKNDLKIVISFDFKAEDIMDKIKFYINDVDGILIEKLGDAETLEFCKKYKELNNNKLLIMNTASNLKIEDFDMVNIVIYKDQLLRASYDAMLGEAQKILTKKLEDNHSSLSEISSSIEQG